MLIIFLALICSLPTCNNYIFIHANHILEYIRHRNELLGFREKKRRTIKRHPLKEALPCLVGLCLLFVFLFLALFTWERKVYRISLHRFLHGNRVRQIWSGHRNRNRYQTPHYLYSSRWREWSRFLGNCNPETLHFRCSLHCQG